MDRTYDHDQIARLYATGLSSRQVAREVGCSRSLVSRVVLMRGITRSTRRLVIDTDGEERAAELYATGLSVAKVAREMGRSIETVRMALRRRGVEMRRRAVLSVDHADMLEAGIPAKDIAARMGVHIWSVRVNGHKHGVYLGLPRGERGREVRDSIARDWTDAEVADEYGVRLSTAATWRRLAEVSS